MLRSEQPPSPVSSVSRAPSVLFCTPCYGAMVQAAHFRSCLKLKETLTQVGLAHDWLVQWNESLVHRGRMEMIAAFLRTSHSHLFWIDADIEFTPQDVAHVWNMQADVGVGIYCMKKRHKQWFAVWKDGELVEDLDRFGAEPVEVDYAGTGFMCIRREVIEKLAAAAPTFEGRYGPVPAIMMTPIHNGVLESEDYHFCRIAREAGFRVMAHPQVRLPHWGQYAFGGAEHDEAAPR